MTYRQKVWRKALGDAETDLMRLTPTIPGGRKANESVLHYVERCRREQDKAIENFRIAKTELEQERQAEKDMDNE